MKKQRQAVSKSPVSVSFVLNGGSLGGESPLQVFNGQQANCGASFLFLLLFLS